MQTKIDRKLSVSATATLAELYEKQKHHFASYLVYWVLYQRDGRALYAEKLEQIGKEIFTCEIDGTYSSEIKDIFNQPELERLRIVPQETFVRFLETLNILLRDEDEEISGIDENEADNLGRIGKVIGAEWQQMFENEATSNKTDRCRNLTVEDINWDEIKLSDFVEFLVRYEGKNRLLSDVKLSDLMERFFENHKLNR